MPATAEQPIATVAAVPDSGDNGSNSYIRVAACTHEMLSSTPDTSTQRRMDAISRYTLQQALQSSRRTRVTQRTVGPSCVPASATRAC